MKNLAEKIFINYRREDSQHPAGRLYDLLEQAFDNNRIFIDVDHIGDRDDDEGREMTSLLQTTPNHPHEIVV